MSLEDPPGTWAVPDYAGPPGRSGHLVRVLARAKLTLSLRVLGRRPDGYHDLDALVVSLEHPHDVVTVRVGPTPGVSLSTSGPAGAGVPRGEANLAVRAAEGLLRAADDGGAFAGAGLEITLHKVIPAGAGLGGGSADAAATLVAGQRLLGLSLAASDLATLAAELGSDVPFCLVGGSARMRGRGERLERAEPVTASTVVAVPPFAVSTAAVYAAWDDLGGPVSARRIEPPPGLAGVLPEGLINDLEPAAEQVEPRLAPFRHALEQLARAPAVLAGSGSAYALVGVEAGRAADVAREVQTRLGARSWATRVAREGVARG